MSAATLAMPDSIHVADLPDGYGQYAGYADGDYATEAELRARFPDAELVIFTVTGNATAHGIKIIPGIDSEPGNPDAKAATAWVQRQLSATPGSRPVVYADLASPGYSMNEVIAELKTSGITTDHVRLLSAHYGLGQHICRPATCAVTVAMNGTQWTDEFAGVDGRPVDMSALAGDFFGTPAPDQWTEFDMTRLPVLHQGDEDKAGAFFYVHRLQNLLSLAGKLNDLPAAMLLAGDGDFGPLTVQAVKAVQAHYKIPQTGTADAGTWSVLLTGNAS